MTDIQVKFWTLKESVRHNVATEGQWKNELKEASRHNIVTESQGQQGINETIRHNKVSEGIETLKANASMITSLANQRNAATNASKAIVENKLNTARTVSENISNYIGGAGIKLKAITSIANSASTAISNGMQPGFQTTKMLTDIWKIAS